MENAKATGPKPIGKRIWVVMNDIGTMNVLERTDTGLTCLKRVVDEDELKEFLKTIDYCYVMKDF